MQSRFLRPLTARLAASSVARALDPWLVLVVAVGTWARFSRIGEFDNQYYTATVASMLRSWHNFAFGSFDPGGAVMVDKPPAAFWVQAIFARLFGVSTWSVNLPQAITGTVAIIVLYYLIKPAFGRVAAVAAAAVLVVVPASIVIDSRNEPDGLLYFALLLAAACIIRAAQTGRWRWLLAFSLLMGFAFNVKMLAAFVPLPAFLLYYLLAARLSYHKLASRAAVAMALLLAASFSWATLVAVTPADSRPYVGSTRDNSIWTLVFEYNGLNRFGGFIRGRPTQPLQGAPGDAVPPPGVQQQPGVAPDQAADAPAGPPAANGGPQSQGVLGLLANPLAAQLGWLLPVAILMSLVAVATVLSEPLVRRPLLFLHAFRDSPPEAQVVLWVGWLATAAVVFGVAVATTTHPYYLVSMAVPMAAVIGIGFATLWRVFPKGALLAWVPPVALLGGAAYQVFASSGMAGNLIAAVVIVVVLAVCTVMACALWRKLADTPLARGALAAGAVALLGIPLVFGLHFGGRIANVGPNQQQPPPQQLPQGAGGGPERQRILAVSTFIQQQGDAGARFALGMVSAREAAPFIIEGVPAVAIGGFSGGDPVFTVEAFRGIAERGDLHYFLMPREAGPATPQGARPQGPVLNYIRTTWQDVSRSAGLPLGSLYRYQGE